MNILKKLLEHSLIEKVHTLPRKSGVKSVRGGPDDPARCFDKKLVNRSVLKKLGKKPDEFFAVQGDVQWEDMTAPDYVVGNGGNCVMVQVMGGDVPELDVSTGKYSGINVVFWLKDDKLELADHKPELVTGDKTADEQARAYEKQIVKAAFDALKKGNLPGVYDGLGGKEHKMPKIGLSDFKAQV